MMNIDEEKAKIEIADSNEFETQGQTNAKDQEYDFDYIGFENLQLIEISNNNNIIIDTNNQMENNNENIEQNISFPLNTPNEINNVEFLNKKRNLDTKASKSEKEKDLIQKEKTIEAAAASKNMKFRNDEMKNDSAGIDNNIKLLSKNALSSSSKKVEGVAHYRKKFSRRKYPHIKRKLFFDNKIEEKKGRKKFKKH